MGKNGKK
jgi:hypothetical protein